MRLVGALGELVGMIILARLLCGEMQKAYERFCIGTIKKTDIASYHGIGLAMSV